MRTKILLSGEYVKTYSKLISPNTTLIITERKKTTLNKPKEFIIAILPSNKRIYISSLYYITDITYRLDYDFKRYILTYKEGGANIRCI